MVENKMTEVIENKRKELNEAQQQVKELMDNRMEDAYAGLKKAVVQSVIVSIVAITIYFIWGITWYFWVAFGIAVVMFLAMAVGLFMLSKAKGKLDSLS
ncbi:MAG: hypothetical protein P8179_08060 [Candidatus Thiodiazotropha sp.]